MLLRFAGFELDPDRAELRGPGGEAIKLRPKTFDILTLFAANPGRVLSKQELMEAVWPNVHVGDDSLFQCIREIRTALDDDDRQSIKLVSGRGYLFDAEVSTEALATPAASAGRRSLPNVRRPPMPATAGGRLACAARGVRRRRGACRRRSALAIAAPMFGPTLCSGGDRRPSR